MEEINGTSSRRQSDEEKPPMQKRKTTSLDKPGKNDEILTGGSPLKVACKKPEVNIVGIGTNDFIKSLQLDGNKVVEKDKEADETKEMEFSHSPSLNSTALLCDTTATHYSTAEESPPLERKNLRVKFYEHVQEKEISDYSSMSSNSSVSQSLFESFSGEEIRVTSSDSNSEMNISSDNSDGSILFLGEMNSSRVLRFKGLPCDEDINPNVTAIESTENDASLPGPSTSRQEKRKVTFNPEVYEIVFFPEEWLHEIAGLCGPIREEDDEEEQAPQPEIAAPIPTLAPVKEETTHPEEATTLAVHQSTSNSTTIQNIVQPDHLEYEAMKKQLEDQRQAHEIYRDAMEARLRVEEIARKNAEEQSTNLQKLMQGEIRARLVVEEENSQLLKQLLDAKTDLMRASAQVQDNRNAFQQHLIERIAEKEETSQSFSALLNSTKNSHASQTRLLSESMDADSDCQRMSDIDSTFELNETAENN